MPGDLSRTALAACAACLAAWACEDERDPPLRVAAASSLALALEDAAARFEAETGAEVVLSLAASGKLAAQIRHGAPFDVYAPADDRYLDELADGACGGERVVYARGEVVAWARPGVDPPAEVADLAAGRFAVIALAVPDHAPYGRAARQALRRAGIWGEVEDRVVYASNVRQALQFAETGNADVALTARSLVTGAPPARISAVPPALHDPLELAAAACAGGERAGAGRELVRALARGDASPMWRRHGLAPVAGPGGR